MAQVIRECLNLWRKKYQPVRRKVFGCLTNPIVRFTGLYGLLIGRTGDELANQSNDIVRLSFAPHLLEIGDSGFHQIAPS